MRNILLASTAAVCLMVTVPGANAQSDVKRHEETKKEQVQQPSTVKHQRQTQQRHQVRSTTGQASEEKKDTSKQENTSSEPRKEDISKGRADKKDRNATGKLGSEPDRQAQTGNSKREKSTSATEHDKNASGTATPSQSEKKSTASDQNKTSGDSRKPSTAEAPKSSTQKQENASSPSANTNAKTAPTDKTGTGKAETSKNAAANSAGQPDRVNNRASTADRKAGQIDPQKKVQLSEAISRTHDLAPPVRNLGISITVGKRAPSHIRLRRLPREIVTIAPEYRGYEYFTTEEDVVIVSPRTHEIVAEIPRDATRARAELRSSTTTDVMTSNVSNGGSMPCQVMRRTASGELQPMDRSRLRETTGSAGGQDHLAVKVRGPNGQEMPDVRLPDRRGRIIAETNGSDCRIIVEPGQVDH